MSSIVFTLVGKLNLLALLFWATGTVCHCLFAFPLIVIGRLWSLIVAVPGQPIYEYFLSHVCLSLVKKKLCRAIYFKPYIKYPLHF